MNSELDYFKFYKILPEKEVYALLGQQIPGLSGESTLREIKLLKIIKCFNYYRKLQCRLYEAYGNEQNITPFLDSLATQSLLFY
jgi:hypothetical protein